MTCVPVYTLFLVSFTAHEVAALTQLVDDHFVGGGGEDGEGGGVPSRSSATRSSS